jgi:RHS repeat-associated protein
MPQRNTESTDYRYAYNGMEQDNEIKGGGNSYTTEFRQYDPRLGRWLSLDPLMHQFPWMSPYVGFDNNPIYYIDPFGLASVDPNEPGDDVPEGAPSNAQTGDIYEDKNGQVWMYTPGENGGEASWAVYQGTFDDAVVYPEAVKEAFREDYEREQRNKNSIMGQFLGDMKAWQNVIPEGHSIYYNTPEMAKEHAYTRANHEALENFMIGYMTASIVTPFVATGAVVYGGSALAITSDAALFSYISAEAAVGTLVSQMSRYWIDRWVAL